MTLTELKELRDRVRGLTGPDREVDAEIGCLVRWNPYEPHHYPERSIGAIFAPTGHGWMGFTMPGEDTVRGSWPSPTYTGSTDAALAFSEKVLGTYSLRMTVDPSGNGADLVWWPNGLSDHKNQVVASAAGTELALAIIDATLTALIETME